MNDPVVPPESLIPSSDLSSTSDPNSSYSDLTSSEGDICAKTLVERMLRLGNGSQGPEAADPFRNPILDEAINLLNSLNSGALRYEDLDRMLQDITCEAFIHRSERLNNYFGDVDVDSNLEKVALLIRSLAVAQDGSQEEKSDRLLSFEEFQQRIEDEVFGVVITAHPTFNLPSYLMEILCELASKSCKDGHQFDRQAFEVRKDVIENARYRPETMTLEREHELSFEVLGNLQKAIRALYGVIIDVSAELYPDRYVELTPRLITLASWVGYDLDGRTDIRWRDMIHKRISAQIAQLGNYESELLDIETLLNEEPNRDTITPVTELLRARIALSIRQLRDEATVYADAPDDEKDERKAIRVLSREIIGSASNRILHGSELLLHIEKAIAVAQSPPVIRSLLILRAEIANYGLCLSHIHLRINQKQLLNAVRSRVLLDADPEDPTVRSSYMAAINKLLDEIEPVEVNFGSLINEQDSARRIFILLAQILKFYDSTSPFRFLIAECESAATVLVALYFARLFGIEDKIDISPLFETGGGLANGSRIIDDLLTNVHFKKYVKRRGRLCIQTGYSDSGRYIGQPAAAASIERLRERICQVVSSHGLNDLQIVCFDTHGDSVGRGAHPVSLAERLRYVDPPVNHAVFPRQVLVSNRKFLSKVVTVLRFS